jgi:hypothetical protein
MSDGARVPHRTPATFASKLSLTLNGTMGFPIPVTDADDGTRSDHTTGPPKQGIGPIRCSEAENSRTEDKN